MDQSSPRLLGLGQVSGRVIHLGVDSDPRRVVFVLMLIYPAVDAQFAILSVGQPITHWGRVVCVNLSAEQPAVKIGNLCPVLGADLEVKHGLWHDFLLSPDD